MCTVFYLQEFGLLSKNRDKELPTEEEIVVEKNLKAVRAKGADYFSCAVNSSGCAFVSTAVNGPAWTQAVESDNQELAKRLCTEERKGLEGPTCIVSEMIGSVKSIDEILARLTSQRAGWYGYNVVLADRSRAVVVETQGHRSAVRPLSAKDCVTNHFHELKGHGPQKPADYPNSYARFEYVQNRLETINGRDDLFKAANPRDPKLSKAIWRQGAFHTVSSTVLSIDDFSLFYSASRGAAFERY